MKLLYKYIKCRLKWIVFFALVCIIFSVSFILYRLPLRAVIYPVFLCVFTGLVFMAADFLHVKSRHEMLEIVKKVPAEIDTYIGTIEGVEDEDYQEIIRILKKGTAKICAESEKKYRDMIDYYTMWVHQIKTPIASMRLKLQNEDTPLSRMLSSDLFRIEQYVEMVLAYLRLDYDSNDYVFKEYKIDTIIKQVLKKYAAEFAEKKIHLLYEPAYDVVITDDKWLSFVIEQVLSNALKYTHEGTIKIYISNPKTLCIEDTGIGIDAHDLPRIFEKGYTGYNGRTDKRATGIGLYLCRRICDNLGIGITAESEPEKGTVIKLGLEQYRIGKE